MKKMMMILALLFAMVGSSFAYTSNPWSGNCKVVNLVLYKANGVRLITSNNERGITMYYFSLGEDNPIGKSWLASLLAAKASNSDIFIYFNNSSVDVNNVVTDIDRIEFK